jgi:saccharopine dehydrogenase-like NADP-dependent oxidoreductase
MNKVLVLGGTGRIGQQVIADLLQYTDAEICLGGRNSVLGLQLQTSLGRRVRFCSLTLDNCSVVIAAIREVQLVIHCAGPFHYRDERVLQYCVEERVNYIDVSDHRSFTLKSFNYRQQAKAAGVTAVVNTGIFPGISNSLVRQDVEALDRADSIHLSYVVAGSGGAGPTVMQTTFLGLQSPFEVWHSGKWQLAQPYSEPEWVEFPAPFGRARVYWFDMPEALTLPQAFPVASVITKFGSVPDFYNLITWALANRFPKAWLSHPAVLKFLTWGSYTTTQLTDRFSGVGVAIRSQVTGELAGQAYEACSTLFLPDTAKAAGYGVGSIAQLLLSGDLSQPGVWAVEEVLPTPLFRATLAQRGVSVVQQVKTAVSD